MVSETRNDMGELHEVHVRNPHALFPDMIDPLLALEEEERRTSWGDTVTEESSDSNYFGKGEAWDSPGAAETDYGVELGRFTVGLEGGDDLLDDDHDDLLEDRDRAA